MHNPVGLQVSFTMDYTPYRFQSQARRTRKNKHRAIPNFYYNSACFEDDFSDMTDGDMNYLREETAIPALPEAFDCEESHTEQIDYGDDSPHIPIDDRKTKPEVLPTEQCKKKGLHIGRIITGGIIIVSLLCAFIAAEILAGGGLVSSIKNVFNESILASYFALTTHGTTNKVYAETESLSVIQMGGGGYIWQDGENYYIIISIYKTKEDANAVCKKNQDTEVHEITLYKTTVSGYQAIKSTDNLLVTTLDSMIEICQNLQSGELGVTPAKSQIANLRDTILAKKDALYQEDIPTKILNEAILRVDCAFGVLDGICAGQNPARLAAELRRGISIVMANMSV